ncbi:peptide chain release factor 2 [candidate division WOR-3 bacterium]|nr:peptide chain release factor 2 [candidate division WOR-3 bacterium]
MQELTEKISKLQKFLEIDKYKKEIDEINTKIAIPDFWASQQKARKLTERLSQCQDIVKRFEEIQKEFQDLKELGKLGEDITGESKKLKEKIDKLELEFAFKSEDDKRNAVLTIHPGAGGTESCDWAEMLFRMYLRWFELKKFKASVIQYEPADVAGLKDATIEVRGKFAYGWLKGESGVHRLVRISPFDASHRRHTSFASCFVYPLIEDEVKIEINEKDLKIDTFRASGPGGQYVNKVSSAIRITHIPTNIVVTCQSERSQYQNKQTALRVLRSKLYQLKKDEERKSLEKITPQKYEIGWAREIRSYVFCPYTLVKDHRTGFETHNVQEVMDGNLDPFVRAWLLKTKEE